MLGRVVIELIILSGSPGRRGLVVSGADHGRAAGHHEVAPTDLIAVRHRTPPRHLGDLQTCEAVARVHIIAARIALAEIVVLGSHAAQARALDVLRSTGKAQQDVVRELSAGFRLVIHRDLGVVVDERVVVDQHAVERSLRQTLAPYREAAARIRNQIAVDLGACRLNADALRAATDRVVVRLVVEGDARADTAAAAPPSAVRSAHYDVAADRRVGGAIGVDADGAHAEQVVLLDQRVLGAVVSVDPFAVHLADSVMAHDRRVARYDFDRRAPGAGAVPGANAGLCHEVVFGSRSLRSQKMDATAGNIGNGAADDLDTVDLDDADAASLGVHDTQVFDAYAVGLDGH